eukprot:gb/GECH01012891.1/.p1 GENE.gb/GECH01012891.1/~~gb/GECH01012891.1/.p1  ORF type:complete len:478 (+),score=75.32 gb/GECH01012891.1/:1-1434(+)
MKTTKIINLFLLINLIVLIFSPLTCIGNKPDLTKKNLEDLYDYLNGDQWHRRDGWKKKENVCDWYGVTCRKDGTVVALSLDNNNLKGNLTNFDGFSDLNHVSHVMLGWNKITGKLPLSFCSLQRASSISLEHNQITTAHSCMTDMYNLEQINFAHNLLDIDLAKTFPNNTKDLQIQGNSLSKVSFEKMDRFTKLASLDISNNQIESDISFVKYLPINLRNFKADNNHLSGDLHQTSIRPKNLNALSLAHNKISGRIPNDWISELSELRSLDLSHNNLGGTIPSDIVQLDFIERIFLQSNQFTNITTLPSAKEVDLSDNPFICPIPLGDQFSSAQCDCPDGFEGGRYTQCTICPIGQRQIRNEYGDPVCKKCPSNTYSNTEGAKSCNSCGFLMISGTGWDTCSPVVAILVSIGFAAILASVVVGIVYYFKRREKRLIDSIRYQRGKAPLLSGSDGMPAADPEDSESDDETNFSLNKVY